MNQVGSSKGVDTVRSWHTFGFLNPNLFINRQSDFYLQKNRSR